jgi:hypothetical protein
MKFRKKPVVIDAFLWQENGDHPLDNCRVIEGKDGSFLSEGEVVRYFRRPDMPGDQKCKHCGKTMHHHGWIDTLEGGHIVCPGDWIITGVKNEFYPCKADVFMQTYEAVDSHDVEKYFKENENGN